MANKKEMTTTVSSAPTDGLQSSQNPISDSIPETSNNFNEFNESFRKMQLEVIRQMDPSYLKTVSMSELFDTVYASKPPIIEGLLYPGTHLFVGAPKLGKSFLMAQLAFHVSTGTPLWNFTIRKGTVLYLALEDDYKRLQGRLYRMFGAESNENLFFLFQQVNLELGLMNS